MVILKKYSTLMILVGFVLLLVSLFISVQLLYIVQFALLLIYISIYFLSDNTSISFLSKFKYLILSTILLFFFIQRRKDGGYWGVDEENLSYSDVSIFLQSFFLLFVLIKADRISNKNAVSD